MCVFFSRPRGNEAFLSKYAFFELQKNQVALFHKCGYASQTTPLMISTCPGTNGSLKEANQFTSKIPFFKVNIRQSYLGRVRPGVPCVFVRKYFGKKKRTVIIRFGKKL